MRDSLLSHGQRGPPASLLVRIIMAALCALACMPAVSAAADADAVAAGAAPAAVAVSTGTPPQSMPHFLLLERALLQYQALATSADLTAIAPLPRRSIKPGESWEGFAGVRRLLIAVGDLIPAALADAAVANAAAPAQPSAEAQEAPDPATVFDPALVEALQRFQARHGLDADGVLGPATWRALATPMSARVRQIERTLEHWRTLPPNPYHRALFINIPRFRLYGVSGFAASESQMLQIDVVVGRAVKDLRTPTFVADLTHVIFRPYWDVPRSIARGEILPAARRDATYLARNNFELVDGSGRIVAAAPESLEQLAAGSLRVRQKPGPGNALGAVKFMLPNEHNVYLHDTPAHALFARSRRDFSHGCIRLGDPAALAQFVLQDDPAWTATRITEAMAQTTPLRVNLAEPVRVYIVYGTAIAREDGTVLFLDDLYGLERD